MAAIRPIAGLLLKLRWFGVSGWRWLLILEGIPAFLCGIATLFYLTDWPGQAKWLTNSKCAWITGEFEGEALAGASFRKGNFTL